MPIACPKCGSRFLRESKTRSFKEILQKLWFVAPLRCKDCKTRFVASTFILGDLKYARCPHCYRMDLNGWTGKSYRPPFWMGLKIRVGARRFRCEYCRFNFASFRRRSEAFTFKRWEKMNAGRARAEGRARMADLEAQYEEAALKVDLSEKHDEE
jgi:DNA-directed RNA polymerase subunit RPC12/RpoP